MLGGKRRVPPTASNDVFSERLNASLSVYNAELVPPATSYAGVKSALNSRYKEPTVSPKSRAFFKDNHWRMDGIRNFWAWGAINMARMTASLPYGAGFDGSVRSTLFQPLLVQLHDWQMNNKWYISWGGTGSGMFMGSNPIRYTYPSFRVPQIDTRTSGGPGPIDTRMQARPKFTAVQRVSRATAVVRYYNTNARFGNTRMRGAGSNVNTTPRK